MDYLLLLIKRKFASVSISTNSTVKPTTKNACPKNVYRKLALWLSATIAFVCSPAAFADYQYTYTGNTFSVTSVTQVMLDNGFWYTDTQTANTYLSIRFTSPTLLTGGTNLPSGLNFTISSSGGFSSGILFSTYPYAGPNDPIGTSGNPYNIPVFSIVSVDSAGLPTDWDISINNYYNAPTGRLTQSFMQSSTTVDSLYGGYEGFYYYSGQLNNTPGVWTVTAVAEPESYAMLLAGLGLIGISIRRKKA